MHQKIVSIFVSIFILSFMILFLVLPKNTFSENENRNLEKFPKFNAERFFDGRFIKGFENYITDHFALRDELMGVKTKYQRLLSQKLINDVYVGKDEFLFQRFKKSNNVEKLVKVLNAFKEKIDDSKDGIRTFLMIAPSSGSINEDKLPRYVSYEDEINTINYINSNVTLNPIDLKSALDENKAKYNLYHRLDHHWTTYGAYVAYKEYCKKINVNPRSIDDYKILTVTNDFNGTLYSKANIYSYKPDKIDIFKNFNDVSVEYVVEKKKTTTMYEEDYLSRKDKYAYFLDGNHALIRIINENDNDNDNDNDKINRSDKKVLVIKDSFANCFIPFLTDIYNEIHIIDLRFYKMNVSDYIKDNDIKDVLVLYNIQNILSDTGIYTLK